MARERVEQDHGRRADDLEVQTPFGWRLKAKGPVIISIIIALGVGGFLAYLVRDHDQKAEMKLAEQGSSMKAIAERLDEVGYILTLNEDQRRTLKLDMPESLRRKSR